MEPRIQYAKTSDGVNIAFSTLGEGMPLVRMPTAPYSHVQLESEIPELRQMIEQLAEGRKLVRYDCRGAGLSDRDVSDYSLETHILDLEAVVDHVRLKRSAPKVGAWGSTPPNRLLGAFGSVLLGTHQQPHRAANFDRRGAPCA